MMKRLVWLLCILLLLTPAYAQSDGCTYEKDVSIVDEYQVQPELSDLPLGKQIITSGFGCRDVVSVPKNEEIAIHPCASGSCMVSLRTEQTLVDLVCSGETLDRVSNETITERLPVIREHTVAFEEVAGPQTEIGVPYTHAGFGVIFDGSVHARLGDASIESEELVGYQLIDSPITIHVEEPVTVTISHDTQTTVGIIGDTIEIHKLPVTLSIDGDTRLAPIASCEPCPETGIWRVNEKRNATESVVLVHGLLTDPSTFARLVGQFTERGWPWNIYVLAYDFNQNINHSAQEFALELDRIAGSYERIVLVGHSYGSTVVQAALAHAMQEGNHPFLEKLQGVALAASPNEGTPIFDLYNEVKETPFGKTIARSLLNADIDPENMEVLRNGRNYPRVPGVEYVAIAGVRSYDFSLAEKLTAQLDGVNDGVVTLKSAQHIGDAFFDLPCVNFFSVNLTHTEILEHPASLRMIEKVIATLFSKPSRYQAERYLTITDCNPFSRYAVLGQEVFVDEEDLTVCNCGDGTCGAGETAEICPSDCADLQGEGLLCFLVPPLILGGFVLLFLFVIVHAGAHFLSKRVPKVTRWMVIAMLCAVAVILTLAGVICGRPVAGEFVVLVAFGAFFATFEMIAS